MKFSFAVPESVKYSFTVQTLGRIGCAKRGDPFGFFNIHCCQISKKIEVGLFGFKKFSKKNSHNAETKLEGVEGGPIGFFQHLRCPKTSKKLKGTLWRKKMKIKSHNAETKLKGGPFSLSRYCKLRGKRGKALVQFARSND